MILYNSENNIRDIKPFCRSLFRHSSFVKHTSSLSCSSEAVARLDNQILLKSPPPPNLLTRSAPGSWDFWSCICESVDFIPTGVQRLPTSFMLSERAARCASQERSRLRHFCIRLAVSNQYFKDFNTSKLAQRFSSSQSASWRLRSRLVDVTYIIDAQCHHSAWMWRDNNTFVSSLLQGRCSRNFDLIQQRCVYETDLMGVVRAVAILKKHEIVAGWQRRRLTTSVKVRGPHFLPSRLKAYMTFETKLRSFCCSELCSVLDSKQLLRDCLETERRAEWVLFKPGVVLYFTVNGVLATDFKSSSLVSSMVQIGKSGGGMLFCSAFARQDQFVDGLVFKQAALQPFLLYICS